MLFPGDTRPPPPATFSHINADVAHHAQARRDRRRLRRAGLARRRPFWSTIWSFLETTGTVIIYLGAGLLWFIMAAVLLRLFFLLLGVAWYFITDPEQLGLS